MTCEVGRCPTCGHRLASVKISVSVPAELLAEAEAKTGITSRSALIQAALVKLTQD